MGEVIRFPDQTTRPRRMRDGDANAEPATIIILPAIRIERNPDGGIEPHSGNGAGRRRRRVR